MSARGLTKSYSRSHSSAGAPVKALRGVDLDIRKGATTALVGESGSGKSTLARCLALLEKPDGGEIRFDGKEVSAEALASTSCLRREIQLIFQDPTSALNPRFSVQDIVEEPLRIQKLAAKGERRMRALELLTQVGLPASLFSRRPHELSGGQRQRLAIARALALEPQLLILDEALAGLDMSIQAQLVNLLLDLHSAHCLTYLYISHDLSLVAYLADEVAVMLRGEIVEKARTEELFGNALHPGTRALLAAIPAISASTLRCDS